MLRLQFEVNPDEFCFAVESKAPIAVGLLGLTFLPDLSSKHQARILIDPVSSRQWDGSIGRRDKRGSAFLKRVGGD